MASRLVLVLLLVIFMLKEAASCENPYVQIGHKCIFFGDTLSLNKGGSEALCLALTGQLLKITSPADFQDLVDYMKNKSDPLVPYWLDGSDSTIEGTWMYSSGEHVPMGTPYWGSFSTFQEGESQYPLEDTDRNCVGISMTHFLYLQDADCEELRSPLCEELEVIQDSKLPLEKYDHLQNVTGSSEVIQVSKATMEKYVHPQNFTGSLEESKVSPDLRTPLCDDGTHHEQTGTIYSPGWPGVYPNDLDCWWQIHLAGRRVKLSFASFDTEHYNDILTIWDGERADYGAMLGQFMGHDLVIPDILSNGEYMSLYFLTNSAAQYDGFEIHWEAVEAIPSCDEEYTSPEGQLYSPGFPGNYEKNLDCKYKITTEEGTAISLTFSFFETHDSQDYLKIYDGGDSSASLIMTLSGTQHEIPVISSSTNKVFLTFNSNDDFTSGGFDMSWISEKVVTSCIEEYTSTEGQLYSPGYPGGYYNNLDCEYTITTDDDKIIKMTTTFFETDDSDYVKVYDGGDSSAPLLMTLSGIQHNVPLISSNENRLFIAFHSDDDLSDGGFAMSWISEMACPLPFVKVGSMCLKFLFADLTFGQATVSCVADGGYLAAINSAEELRDFFIFVQQFGIADGDYWLGGADLDEEGVWTWQDGSLVPMGTPFWGTVGAEAGTQEPNGVDAENCLALTSSGFFYFRDQHCTSKYKAVCMHQK